MHSDFLKMFFYSNIGEYSFFAFAFKNHFCFFSAQGLDEAMLGVVGTSDVSVNITFATNNDLVDRIYGVSILLPSRLFSCTIILFFLLVSFQVSEIRTEILNTLCDEWKTFTPDICPAR